MAPRPHWKGYLKLSLVSCPIALYPAISAAERVSFRRVNKRTGNRLRQRLVDAVTGEPVDAYDKGRGYEVGENRFVLVDDEELEAARQAPRMPPPPAAPIASAPAQPSDASNSPVVAASSGKAVCSSGATAPATSATTGSAAKHAHD